MIADALDELLERQEERGVDHAVVHGGEDVTMPSLKSFFHVHRALQRGGKKAIDDFSREMGSPGTHGRERQSYRASGGGQSGVRLQERQWPSPEWSRLGYGAEA